MFYNYHAAVVMAAVVFLVSFVLLNSFGSSSDRDEGTCMVLVGDVDADSTSRLWELDQETLECECSTRSGDGMYLKCPTW